MKIDETTGLPKLPEGHFWRVKFDGNSWYPTLDVQIRRKRKIGSKYVWGWSESSVRRARDVTPKEVLETTTKALEAWEQQKKAVTLFGDYPPKKLPNA